MSAISVKELIDKIYTEAGSNSLDSKKNVFNLVFDVVKEIVNDMNDRTLSSFNYNIVSEIESDQKIFLKRLISEIEEYYNPSYFFMNKNCPMYPCHKTEEGINCMFCYCPLYSYDDCGGDYSMEETSKGSVKNCIKCLIPHRKDAYEYFKSFLEKRGK